MCRKTGGFDTFHKKLELLIGYRIPVSYKEFNIEFGAFSFNHSVQVRCQEKPPVALDDCFIPVDFFYSTDERGKCSIFELIETYRDQIPSGSLPICDGLSGDLICINLKKNGYGEVFYWCHEKPKGSDIFKIADTFEGFVSNLEESNDSQIDSIDSKVVEVKETDTFLNMLKQTGYGPK